MGVWIDEGEEWGERRTKGIEGEGKGKGEEGGGVDRDGEREEEERRERRIGDEREGRAECRGDM